MDFMAVLQKLTRCTLVLRDHESKNWTRDRWLEPGCDQASGGPRGAWVSVNAICGVTHSVAGASAAMTCGMATATATPGGTGPAMP
jgi:hypothetical protein